MLNFWTEYDRSVFQSFYHLYGETFEFSVSPTSIALRRFGSPLISPQLTPRRSCVTVNVPNLSGSAESRLNFFFLLYQKNRTEERTNYQNLSL